MDDIEFRKQSYWHATLATTLAAWPAVDRDQDLDVAIIGGGFSGLWTAYYLGEQDPSLRIAVFEAERVGFGASGRNGGWCVGTMAGMSAYDEDPSGSFALQRALFDTVSEVGRVCQKERIECDWHAGGWLSLALSRAQEKVQKKMVSDWHRQGFGSEDARWLEPGEVSERIRTPNRGALFSPHCAAMHPARLARGLAEALTRRGVAIYENSPVTALKTGEIHVSKIRIRADWVVRATEAYTDRLGSDSRRLLPMHSAVVATEPLPQALWDQIGLPDRETFGDSRRIVIYGQRTSDGRMIFGCRGGYFFGSGIRNRLPDNDASFKNVIGLLHGLFPCLKETSFSHRWVGTLGIPRHFQPTVGIDPQRKLGFAGGYVGEGVAASNLAARTLADLCLGRDSDLTRLPMVGPDFLRWEPEPLRWLGVHGVRLLGERLDRAELADRRSFPGAARLFSRFVKS